MEYVAPKSRGVHSPPWPTTLEEWTVYIREREVYCLQDEETHEETAARVGRLHLAHVSGESLEDVDDNFYAHDIRAMGFVIINNMYVEATDAARNYANNMDTRGNVMFGTIKSAERHAELNASHPRLDTLIMSMAAAIQHAKYTPGYL